MAIENFLTDARSVLTVVSFVTFLGIIWWSYSKRRASAFAEAAMLPFADDADDLNSTATETHHG